MKKNNSGKWMRAFVVMSLIIGVIFGFANISTINADDQDYVIRTLNFSNENVIDDVSIYIPISSYIKYPGSTILECSVTIFGENYSRIKTVDIQYGGKKGVAFSNNDFIEIKTNASTIKKPVDQLVFGKKYFYLLSWRKKGAVEYEFAETIPKSFVMPYPKLNIGNAKIKTSEDGHFCLSTEALNTHGRGRIDWWFEIVCDTDSCNAENCFMNSSIVITNTRDIGMHGHYEVPDKNVGKQYRFRIVGYDYARNEKFESNWYFFKRIK